MYGFSPLINSDGRQFTSNEQRGGEPNADNRDTGNSSGRLYRRPDEIERDLRQRKPAEAGTARPARHSEKAIWGGEGCFVLAMERRL